MVLHPHELDRRSRLPFGFGEVGEVHGAAAVGNGVFTEDGDGTPGGGVIDIEVRGDAAARARSCQVTAPLSRALSATRPLRIAARELPPPLGKPLRTVEERSNRWRVNDNHCAAGSVRFVDILNMNTRRLRGWNRLAVGLLLGSAISLLAGTPPELASRFRDREAVPVSELQRGPRGAHRVAVTFDAGGEADAFPTLLAALAAARARSTFFLTGEWMREHPDLVRLLVSSGHERGNHTWSHSDLTRLGGPALRSAAR